MKKNSVFIFQCIAAILSIIILIFIPFPTDLIWLRISCYLLLFVIAGLMLQKTNNKKINELGKVMGKMKKELEKFNFEVQVASSQVSSVSEQLNITLDENNAFAQQVFAETKEMASLNSDVNIKVSDTLTVVKNVIELFEEARNTSIEMEGIRHTADEVIKSSLEEILDVVSTINEIQESSNGTMVYMDKLNISSKEIMRILETVSNVSKQTHLLALNASIESARAGEAGKGFAVVADEIRKLAVDTGNAVKDVNGLISGIQEEIKSVYDMVMLNSSRVEKGVKVSRKVEGNLEQIDNSIKDVFAMLKKINELSEKEVKMTNEVSEKIGSVEKVVVATAESVDEVYDSVHKQKHSVQDIADMGTRLNDASKNLALLIENTGASAFTVESTKAVEKVAETLRIINSDVLRNSGIQAMDKEIHRNLLSSLLAKYEFIEAVWSNDKKGRFICSIPEAGIANACVREWFKRGISGEEYVSSVYISAITKSPCITISVPIKSGIGEIIGVIGVDLKLNM